MTGSAPVHWMKTTRTVTAGRVVYIGTCSCRQWSSGFRLVAVQCWDRFRVHRAEVEHRG